MTVTTTTLYLYVALDEFDELTAENGGGKEKIDESAKAPCCYSSWSPSKKMYITCKHYFDRARTLLCQATKILCR